MSEYPFLPIPTGEYVADTADLTTEEHGALILILLKMWRSEGCRLPTDDQVLAKAARVSRKRWIRIWEAIRGLFVEGEDGLLRHKRLSAQYEYVRKSTEQKRRAGRASAERKRGGK